MYLEPPICFMSFGHILGLSFAFKVLLDGLHITSLMERKTATFDTLPSKLQNKNGKNCLQVKKWKDF